MFGRCVVRGFGDGSTRLKVGHSRWRWCMTNIIMVDVPKIGSRASHCWCEFCEK